MFHGTYASNEEYIETFKIIAPLYDVNFDAEAWEARMRTANVNVHAHNYAFSVNKPNYDVREQLKTLQIPTLITVGRHDWICPLEASEEMHALLPVSQDRKSTRLNFSHVAKSYAVFCMKQNT